MLRHRLILFKSSGNIGSKDVLILKLIDFPLQAPTTMTTKAPTTTTTTEAPRRQRRLRLLRRQRPQRLLRRQRRLRLLRRQRRLRLLRRQQHSGSTTTTTEAPTTTTTTEAPTTTTTAGISFNEVYSDCANTSWIPTWKPLNEALELWLNSPVLKARSSCRLRFDGFKTPQRVQFVNSSIERQSLKVLFLYCTRNIIQDSSGVGCIPKASIQFSGPYLNKQNGIP